MKTIITEIAKKLQGDSLAEKVKEIIAKQLILNASKIMLESSFVEDLGADSLDIIELVMAFEEAFGIEIPDEDVEMIVTVKDAVECVRKMRAGVMK